LLICFAGGVAGSPSICKQNPCLTIDFAADDQACIIHERLMRLFIYKTMFTISESRAVSHSNDTGQQAQEWLEILDFQKNIFTIFG